MRKAYGLLLVVLLLSGLASTVSKAGRERAEPRRLLAIGLLDGGAVVLKQLPDLTEAGRFATRFSPAHMTALEGTGRVFVFPQFTRSNGFMDKNLRTRSASRIDTASPFFGQPNEDGTKLYVTNVTVGGAVVVDTASDQIVGSLVTTPRPDFMSLDAIRHELYVADNSNGALGVYDTLTDTKLREFRAPAIQQVVVAAGKVYWTTGSTEVHVNDALTFAPITTVLVTKSVRRLGRSADLDRIWVVGFTDTTGEVAIIDTATDGIVASHSFSGDAWNVVVDEATSTAYVAQTNSGTIGVLDLTTSGFTTIPQDGRPYGLAIVDVP